jgi:tight adherence protein B
VLLPIAVLIFVTALCIFVAVYLGVSEKHASPKAELRRRLQRMARSSENELPEELKSEIAKETKPLDLVLARLPFTRDLDRKLDHAGLKTTASSFVMITGPISLAIGALAGLRSGSFIVALAGIIATPLVANIYLYFKIDQRREKFTELFPDALAMVSRSLRAGHSFTTAIQLVGQEIPAPVGELFKTAYDQQLLGLRITDGLANMNERMESLDLRFFTTVVAINSEVGGNLSEVLDKLAVTIRERLRIRRQVRVYTAQGRMSGYVLGALPLVAFVIFNILYASYESVLLKEPMGIYILAFAGAMQITGLLIIRKIVRIQI